MKNRKRSANVETQTSYTPHDLMTTMAVMMREEKMEEVKMKVGEVQGENGRG